MKIKWRRFDDVRRKCGENEGVCLMLGKNVVKMKAFWWCKEKMCWKWRCLLDVRGKCTKIKVFGWCEGKCAKNGGRDDVRGEKVLKNLENWTNFKEKRLMNKYVDKKVSKILIQRIYN